MVCFALLIGGLARCQILGRISNINHFVDRTGFGLSWMGDYRLEVSFLAVIFGWKCRGVFYRGRFRFEIKFFMKNSNFRENLDYCSNLISWKLNFSPKNCNFYQNFELLWKIFVARQSLKPLGIFKKLNNSKSGKYTPYNVNAAIFSK